MSKRTEITVGITPTVDRKERVEDIQFVVTPPVSVEVSTPNLAEMFSEYQENGSSSFIEDEQPLIEYQFYKEIGGSLPYERYQLCLQALLDFQQNNRPVPAKTPARNLARHANMTVTPEEEFLYQHNSDSRGNGTEPHYARTKYDQQILADALLLRGELIRWYIYTAANPVIFGKYFATT